VARAVLAREAGAELHVDERVARRGTLERDLEEVPLLDDRVADPL
jgi:hypothetical protein